MGKRGTEVEKSSDAAADVVNAFFFLFFYRQQKESLGNQETPRFTAEGSSDVRRWGQ